MYLSNKEKFRSKDLDYIRYQFWCSGHTKMNVQVQFSICSKIQPNIQKDIHNESFYQYRVLILHKPFVNSTLKLVRGIILKKGCMNLFLSSSKIQLLWIYMLFVCLIRASSPNEVLVEVHTVLLFECFFLLFLYSSGGILKSQLDYSLLSLVNSSKTANRMKNWKKLTLCKRATTNGVLFPGKTGI